MVFQWWIDRRPNRWLQVPCPEAWVEVLTRNVAAYSSMTALHQQRVQGYVNVFVREKHWEGCAELQVTDEMRVTIAGQIAVLVSGLGKEFFDRVLSILIYPDAYVAPQTHVDEMGIVTEGPSTRLGEAWYRGPVILAWDDALAGARGELGPHNLIVHEFTHQLDMLNSRRADGVPPIESPQLAHRWLDVMQRHYHRLVEQCDQGYRSLLDCYGAQDLSEFFAVSSEAFFQVPRRMQVEMPELYQLLDDFYQPQTSAHGRGGQSPRQSRR
ncbi:MAG: zinc-dependent peptidase [Planctomycetaceae bacterium]|nr:zinc-dependent peptidase [Planctomycetaceae bacterium]